MRIALDYDGTFTADPELWSLLIHHAERRGHEVVVVTMRRPDEPITGMLCEVVYTSRRAKVPFMADLGVKVDVWIDDSPHWLVGDSA